MTINSNKRMLSRFEASKLTGLPERSLKNMVSKNYKFIKPPHKKIGKTTFYGPADQLLAWYNSDLEAKPNTKNTENNKSVSDKSDIKIKVIK